MILYLFLIAITSLFVVLSYVRTNTINNANQVAMGNYPNKLNGISSFLLVVLFTSVAGLRYFVGTDFRMYVESFLQIDTHSFLSNFELLRFEPGFMWLLWISRLLSPHPITFFLVSSFLVIFGTMIAYRASTDSPPLAILYWLLFGLFFFSLNGTRQAIAAPITILAWHCLQKDFKYRFIALIGFAALFHVSAVLAGIAFVFFHYVTWNWKRITLLFFSILAFGQLVFFSDIIVNFIVFLDPRFQYYFRPDFGAGANASWFGVLSRLTTVSIVFLFARKIKLPQSIFEAIALLVTGAGFWHLSSFAPWFFRIDAYFEYLIPIAILQTASLLDETKRKQLIILTLAYGTFHYFAMLRLGWHEVIPYRIWPEII